MRVLHLINNLGSGGAEKLLEDLIPLMNRMGSMEIDILLLTDKNNVFYDSLIDKGVKVDVVKYRNMYDFRNIFELNKYIVDGGYDIVHSHTFPTQMWVAFLRLFLGSKKVKLITTEHSTHNRRREKLYFRLIDKLIYSQYDSKDLMMQFGNQSLKKIEMYKIDKIMIEMTNIYIGDKAKRNFHNEN